MEDKTLDIEKEIRSILTPNSYIDPSEGIKLVKHFGQLFSAELDKAVNTSKVTRFEVIDHRDDDQGFLPGRILTEHGVKVELSFQDENRTLKVFLSQPTNQVGEGGTK